MARDKMKKIFILTQLTLAIAGYSSYASAGGHHHHHHHRGHHHHHHRDRGYYPRAEVHHYYAPPVVHHYHPQPQVNYYPAPYPGRGYYDQRTGAGLVGGVVGSALGYEMGHGDPIAAGLGAAAGSYLGNRY
jgi:hypothetical protein